MTPQLPMWQDVAKPLLDAKVPDEVYDAQRDAYFQQFVLPAALKAGESPTNARENFMKASERPGKSSMPRLALTGAAALKGLTDPLSIVVGPELKKSNEEMVNEAAREAARQGISPTPYVFGGELLGSAPYFVGGFAAAKGAMTAGRLGLEAAGVSETAAKIATEAATAGVIQGTYDAAKADEGHRLVEGLQGAAVGTALVGGVMSLGPLRRALQAAHNLPPEMAAAVEQTARGVATPTEEALAAQAPPAVQQTIQQWMGEQIQAAKKAGLPKDAMMAEPGGRMKIQLKTADGKTYNVGGVTGAEIQNIGSIVDRISPHLDAGGEILSVNADPEIIQKFGQEMERINTAKGMFDQELPLGEVGKAAGVTVKVKPKTAAAEAGPVGRTPAAPSPSAKPTPSTGSATAGTAYVGKDGYMYDGEVWKPAPEKAAAEWYVTDSGRTLPKKSLLAKIENERSGAVKPTKVAAAPPAEMPPSEALEVLPNGKVRDKGTGTIYDNAYQALAGRGVIDPTIEAYPQLSKLPDGRIFNAENKTSYGSLEEAVMSLARKARYDDEFMKIVRKKHADLVANGNTDAAAAMEKAYGPFKQRSMGEAPEAGTAQRPTQYREVHDVVEGNASIGGSTIAPPNSTPRITYARDSLNPGIIFHETLHGGLGTTGLAQDFTIMERLGGVWTKMVNKLSRAWPLDVQVAYRQEGHVGEEVYAYLSSAIRTNDERMIQQFIDADGGREDVMKWAAETTDTLLDSLSNVPDSVHRRVLERKLREVYRRSSNELRAITGDTSEVYGADVDVINGKYIVRNPEGKLYHFQEKEELIDYLEKTYNEPLGSPNLIDETAMPSNVPRYARNIPPHTIGRKPVETPPPTMEGPGAEKLGAALASFFVRPFYPWLDSVQKKLGRPDIYDAFKSLDVKMVQRDAFIERYENPLKRAIVGKSLLETKYPPARQKDLYMYLQAKPGFEQAAAQKLNITPGEMADIAQLRAEVIDPLAADTGIDFMKYIQEVAPLMRRTADPEAIKAGVGGLTKREAEFWKNAIIKGEIDPFQDRDLLRTTHAYIRLVARDKTIGQDLDAVKRLVDEKIPGSDDYRLGSLRPLLQRQLEYIKGRPDYTQRLLDGATQGAIDLINKGIEQVNKALPGGAQIDTIDAIPRDVLGRWILFSYAGGLALRPMVVVRDSMQLFLTTFPILGGKYTARGLQRAFPALKEGIESDAWRIADQYGALMHQSDLQNLYSGGYETLTGGGKVTGKVTNFAEWSLKWLQWSNNSNRLVTFWGHAERNLDAIAKNVPGQNAKQLIKDAGWQHLDDRLRENLVKEVMSADADKWKDIAYRAAKELTDISQWNYRRGASPGLYKYSMGRLFGQYGTWPLNYIEYARRLISKGDAADKSAALTRLALAHGAVLKTGEMLGVDTGQWVFTQPIAYGGSPIFQAIVNLPGTMDFETYRGTESRREIARIFWPMEVPGGLAAERIYKAITADSPTALQEALGFQPLKPGEEDKGIHSIIP